jgi:hypothetical protein
MEQGHPEGSKSYLIRPAVSLTDQASRGKGVVCCAIRRVALFS